MPARHVMQMIPVDSLGVLCHLKSLVCSCSYFEFLISLFQFFSLFPYFFTILCALEKWIPEFSVCSPRNFVK